MAYENCGVIVVICQAIAQSTSVKVSEHGQGTRSSQKRPIQQSLWDISGSFSPTEEHCCHVLPCGICARHPGSFLFSRRFIGYTHSAISRQKFHTVWCKIFFLLPSMTSTRGHTGQPSVLVCPGSADFPDSRQLVPKSFYRARSLYCTVLNDLANSDCCWCCAISL
jgi:hypothetical protein